MLPALQDEHSTLAADLAHVSIGVLSLPELAAKHGVSETETLEFLADDALVAKAEALAVGMQLSGAASQSVALACLNSAVEQLRKHVDTGTLGPGALRGIIETLYRVSGMGERAAAAARAGMENDSKFTVNINLSREGTDSGKPHRGEVIEQAPQAHGLVLEFDGGGNE